MSHNLTKEMVFSSIIWKFLERGGTQGIQFIIQIFLARLLSPNDYGVIALITVFIALANVFVQSGFNTALIQKQDIDETDFSSVFCISLLIATILYFVLFFSAPLISSFYEITELVKIIRILSLTLFLGAISSIQNAIIARKMMFKKLFYSSFCSIFISGYIALILAFKNFGVWSLVYQQLLNQLFMCLILGCIVKWKPSFILSLKRLKVLFKFGGKLLLSNLIYTLYDQLTNLIVGKVYNSNILGSYNRGMQFPSVIGTNIDNTIQSVLFPVLSLEQNNRNKIKKIMRRAIITSFYLMCPMMFGLFIISENLVELLLTQKWLSSVPYLRIFCIYFMLLPINTSNLQAINAMGRSDIFLKLEIIKKIIGIIIIYQTVKYNPLIMAIGILISGIIGSFINTFPNRKLLNYSYLEQMKDILPAFLLSIVMGIFIYLIIFLKFSNVMTIFLQVVLGAIIYVALSYLLKLECFMYLLNIILNLKKRG